MVKRPKSPDLPDDARYVVVHQPYPLNANFELPGDYLAFAFWAATVLGDPRGVWGVHRKPKARSTVILEVDKRLPPEAFQALLGEHRWDEILKEPREEEKERMSKAYFCVYGTQRAAEKDGWHKIHVEQEWFVEKGWNLTGGPFTHPYPPTHWCPPLPEDPTNRNIALPLPVWVKPPPPAQPTLVPGSAEWVRAVQAGRPTGEEREGVWRGARGGARGNGGNGNGERAGQRGRPANQRVVNPAPTPVLGSTAVASKNAWTKIAASGSGGSTAGPSSSSSSLAQRYPNAPPGLTRQGDAGRVPLVPPGLEALVSMGLSDSESDDGGAPVKFAEDSGDDLDALFPRASSSSGYIQAAPPSGPKYDNAGDLEHVANLWAQIERQGFAFGFGGEGEEPMCSFHPGTTCPKGICKERQQLVRERKKREAAEEREKKIEEAKKKKTQRRKQRARNAKEEVAGEGRVVQNRFRRKKNVEAA